MSNDFYGKNAARTAFFFSDHSILFYFLQIQHKIVNFIPELIKMLFTLNFFK